MGGPPLVLPKRVKVGGSLRNDEEGERNTFVMVIPPLPKVRAAFNYNECVLERLNIIVSYSID